MNNFNRGNNKFGGGRDFKRPSFGGGRRDSSTRPEMHDAVCGKCGKDCQVPFRPTGTKPVFCSDCFERNTDSGSGERRFERRDSRESGRSFGNNFEKNYDRSERSDRGNDRSTGDQYKKQFESLNWKLDKILKLLSPVEVPQEIFSDVERIGKAVKITKPKSASAKSSSETKKAKNATNIEKIVATEE